MVDKNINRINKLGICLRKLKKKGILFIKFHQILNSIFNKSKNNFIKIQSIVQENLLIKKLLCAISKPLIPFLIVILIYYFSTTLFLDISQ